VKRDFGGEAAGYYHQYRHGYPSAVIGALVGAFKLTGQDVLVDLGCGTGQLTLPVAGQVRAVIGVDVEPAMLEHARQAALDTDVRNVMWMLGADADIPALRRLLGDRSVGAVTIAQALHWMNHQDLFRAVVPLVRPGGGIAVVTNGTPLWLQETDWSRALRDFLEHWLATTLTYACGTDEQSQQRYREDLAAAGFEVVTTAVDYVASLDIDQLVGGVYSAMGSRIPAASQRPAFAEQVRAAVAPQDRFSERVHVAILTGTR
jgi:ubiquinone/menaquinone biosynthesis C-methylase UbiE